MRRLVPIALLVASVALMCGCVNDEDIFTEGRIENPCNSAIPVCHVQAACILGEDEFIEGTFPGGRRLIVRTEADDARIVIRFLLKEMAFPGSEMQIQVYRPDCDDFDEEHLVDMDLFELAGDDRILEFELGAAGRGDHYVEIFSDMAADFAMTIEVVE